LRCALALLDRKLEALQGAFLQSFLHLPVQKSKSLRRLWEGTLTPYFN